VHDYLNTTQESYLARNLAELTQMCFGVFRIPSRLLGFIASANNDGEFSNLRPWVVSLRGHYSNRKITRRVSSKIEVDFFQEPSVQNSQAARAEMAVHFRLGDLLYLDSKEPLKIESLSLGISQAKEFMKYRNSPIFICSDSVDIAKSNLEGQFPDEKLVSVGLAPRETIHFLGEVSCFIGTPSKISEWVTIFRVNSGSSLVTFLPRQMSSQAGRILEETTLIHYY
jgi:hypothetical protein